ncbi:hypothetical protein BXO88_03655 [Oribacterium sp. C9]|uniref:spermidine synthase n=1 Tax=Oribacterium sp. C9 TaxID=1943579 RepID=UPI00098FF22E|nr:hypothetical protein [Oribacterium sp. C9]OON87380.1 hypothetical protein BXO88_03655 [Oribacterium sp. C9]
MDKFDIDDIIDERKTLYTTEDPLTGKIEVCEGYYDEEYMRFLLVDGSMQSAELVERDGELELPFDYMESFNWIFRLNKNIRRTLLIGGGGFAYPKYYLEKFPNRYIDAIEISQTVIDVARGYFGLSELEEKAGEHLRIIVGDGNAYLIDLALKIRSCENKMEASEKDTEAQNTKNGSGMISKPEKDSLKYDVIINDAFVGHKSSSLLKKSAELIKTCLNENGIYAANMVIPLKGPGSLQPKKDMEVFAEVFNYTFLLPCDDELNPYAPQNCVFFASDSPFEM